MKMKIVEYEELFLPIFSTISFCVFYKMGTSLEFEIKCSFLYGAIQLVNGRHALLTKSYSLAKLSITVLHKYYGMLLTQRTVSAFSVGWL